MDMIQKSPAIQFGLVFLAVGLLGLIANGTFNAFLILGLAFTAGAYIQSRYQNK